MSMVSKLKKLKNNPWVLWLWNERRRIKGINKFQKISDENFIKQLYYNSFNKYPNLNNPITFNEKIQWLKLNYREPIMTTLSDKYEVRRYLEEKGYKHLLNDLIGVYESVEDIDIAKLPNKFVLKGSHGSGWNLIVDDKNKINWVPWKLVMKSWLKQNLYYYGREFNYKNMKPRIICEKLLETKDGVLKDYKVFCFNGNPEFIQVDIGRNKDHYRNFYDLQWNLCGFYKGINNNPSCIIQKPANLDEIIKIAKDLSRQFPFARIDFYNVENKLYFGEITFYPASGTTSFMPLEYENIIGELIKIN